MIVKLPAHRAGLPGHAVASRMRANEISFFLVHLDPAYKARLAGHLPVTPSPLYVVLSYSAQPSLAVNPADCGV
jgi:hypothetical protein